MALVTCVVTAAAAAAVIGASSISPECSLKLSDDPESVAILNAKNYCCKVVTTPLSEAADNL